MLLTHQNMFLVGKLVVRWILTHKVGLTLTTLMVQMGTWKKALIAQSFSLDFLKAIVGICSSKLFTGEVLDDFGSTRTRCLHMAVFTTEGT